MNHRSNTALLMLVGGFIVEAARSTFGFSTALAGLPSDATMATQARPIASYTLEATVEEATHTIHGKGSIVWINASRIPQRELFVHLYLNAFKTDGTIFMREAVAASDFRGGGVLAVHGFVRVHSFTLRGGPDLWPTAAKTTESDPEDETDIRVPLPEEIPPGASVTIDMEWESHLPSLLLRTGFAEDFTMGAQWFPKIARLEPDGSFAHFPFHHLSEFYADFGTYDVIIDTESPVIVGATGRLVAEERTNGRVRRRFVQESVHDFAFTAWRGFKEVWSRAEDGTSVRLLFPSGFERAARAELSAVNEGLSFFGRALGPYPYETLTVVHPPPFAGEASGMEYPTLITTGGSWYAPYTGFRGAELVAIHELGHQWFYGMVATDEHRFPFLDEGLTSYAEWMAMEHRFPDSSVASLLGLSIGLPALQRQRSVPVARHGIIASAAEAFKTGGDYGGLVYGRTSTTLGTLARVYGEDGVERALGLYARRYRFCHPGPSDLLGVLGEVLGEDAREQFRIAIFEGGTVDYSVAELSPSSAVVRRSGTLSFPVNIELETEDGRVRRVRWDGRETSIRLTNDSESRLVAAVVDPDHRILLDDDFSNNAQRVRARRPSASVMDLLTFGAEVLLGGVFP